MTVSHGPVRGATTTGQRHIIQRCCAVQHYSYSITARHCACGRLPAQWLYHCTLHCSMVCCMYNIVLVLILYPGAGISNINAGIVLYCTAPHTHTYSIMQVLSNANIVVL